MTENIKKLLELVSGNEELKDRVGKACKDELIAIAKEHGITLTDADFEQNNEISDDALDSVAGGIDQVAFRGNQLFIEMERYLGRR